MSSTVLPKSPHLNMEHFNKLYKYKFIIPAIYILCWVGMIFGPIYFGNVYTNISLVVVVVGMVKYASMFIGGLISCVKNLILIEKVKKKSKGEKNYVSVPSVT
jgi:hypothetical protein